MQKNNDLDMDIRRSFILSKMMTHWGIPTRRYFAYFKPENTDRVEVYSFPGRSSNPAHRFATIGASAQFMKSGQQIKWELMMALPPDIGVASEEWVQKALIDIVATSIGLDFDYHPKVVIPESPLFPKAWPTRGLVFDEPLAEPQDVSQFTIETEQVKLLWVLPIYTQDRKTEIVNPAMIVLARESRGHTQAQLATAIHVNRTTLLRYESGLLEVPDDRLRALAEVLDYPIGFFFMQERVYNASCLYHRKRQRIPVKQLRKIHAQVNILRIRATRLLLEAEIESENRFHRLELEKCGSPEEAAKTLRYLWQLPAGPIGSVIGEIERAGGLVFRCPFGTAKVDAISQWPLDAPGMPPVFFVSDQTPGDRQRWTLAHEIGHVVLHHLPTSNPEKEADRFASEFMMPAKDAGTDLRNLTLEKAASLKSWWRVSMAAIIKRAADLGKLSERQYRYLFMQLSAAGYRKCEPVVIKAQEPTMFDEIMKVHRADHGRGPHELSSLLNMHEADFLAEFWQSYSGLKLVI